MASNSTNTTKCLNKSTPKRNQAPSASSENNSSPAIKKKKTKQKNSKRTYHELSHS